MDPRATGDMEIASKRANEKSDLQNLNHRFAAYIQAVRSAHDIEAQRKVLLSSSETEERSFQTLKSQYEQQISELQAKIDDISREKQELELNRSAYDTTLSEYESRVVALNQCIFEKQNDFQRLHSALAAKDVEIQEAKSDAIQPRLALDGARMEIEDLKKRLQESDRRLQLEIASKGELEQILSDLQGKMQREIAIYQEELTGVRHKLEKSHELTLQLEEKVRNANHSDSSLVELMKKVREASEAELRRFMDETEAKYNLNIQEVKMRMDADVKHLTALAEENAQLKSQLDAQLSDIRSYESKLAMLEEQRQAAEKASASEKTMCQATVRNLEVKLQETQDLLLVKIQELGAAQEANIPLRAEINALKVLIEEEEKRLNLETLAPGSPFASAMGNRQQLTTSTAFLESLGLDSRKQAENARLGLSSNSNQTSGTGYNYTGSFLQAAGHQQTRPGSEPNKSSSFDRHGYSKFSATNLPSNYSDAGAGYDDRKVRTAVPTNRSAYSPRYDFQNNQSSGESQYPVGIDNADKPQSDQCGPETIPRRPLSAARTRFIPPSGSQGKDYFNVMFNDLRKDTLYSKVTEDGAGHATAQVSSSVDQDYINSTSSATGNLKVLQIADDGSSVTITNSSSTQEENLGGFMLQQNVGGHVVAVFRFPPRASLRAASSTTVWSAKAVNGVHNPPYHYIWSKLDKWGTGPECTTILCQANGQAVAWMTSAPRVVKKSKMKYAPNVKQQTEETRKLLEDLRVKNQMNDDDSIVEDDVSENSWKPDAVVLPDSYTKKPVLYSNDGNSPNTLPSINKSKHMKTSVTSGLLPSRTGASPLHLHQSRTTATHQVSENGETEHPYSPPYAPQHEDNGRVELSADRPVARVNGRRIVKSAPEKYGIDNERKVTPGQSVRMHLPGTFWSPGEQHAKGMQWINAQHNANFIPPMPKAFPCVKPIYRNGSHTR